MINLTTQIQNAQNMTEQEKFSHIFSTYCLIDIGYIINTENTENGLYGTIECRAVGGLASNIYTNVELLSVGSKAGGLKVPLAGNDAYLCLCPRNALDSVSSGRPVAGQSRYYTVQGMKAIPVANMNREGTSFGVDETGEFFIEAGDLVLTMGPEAQFSLSQSNILYVRKTSQGAICIEMLNRMVYSADLNRNWSLYYIDDDRKILSWEMHRADGSQTKRWGYKEPLTSEELVSGIEAYEFWLRDESSLADGTKTTIQKDVDGNILSEKTITPDGGITYKHTNADGDVLADIALPADGSIAIKLIKGDIDLSISAEGDLAFVSAKAVDLDVTGALTMAFADILTLETTKDMTLKSSAKLILEAAQDASLKSTSKLELNSPATTLTGGTVKIGGSVAPTGSGALCGLPACLFTGAPHTGDTASGA